MNKMFQKVLVAGAALLIAAPAFGADTKLGFVDLKKVFDKYYKTVQAGAANSNEVLQIGREEIVDSDGPQCGELLSA